MRTIGVLAVSAISCSPCDVVVVGVELGGPEADGSGR
jgi:hypothetical protein